ncbi:hypothetical protein CEXT_227031 [Caerostris extrusa]|uniref:Uncharacterized protein n=1 Tax=Caerostris extrusa TaxID=172846 RepID=A0AAV4XUU5_CAEEX|nr:hypothetical protein CEXT_227031 [Caerostris extrusa]
MPPNRQQEQKDNHAKTVVDILNNCGVYRKSIVFSCTKKVIRKMQFFGKAQTEARWKLENKMVAHTIKWKQMVLRKV